MPDSNGDLTVRDLPLREQVRAHMPATASLLAMLALVLLAASWYTNTRSDEAQRKANRLAAEVQRVSEARFEYATNRSVCGFRKLATDGITANLAVIARSRAALRDKAITPGAKKRNAKARVEAERAIGVARAFLETQVTVPFDYDCSKLPDKPPPSTRPTTTER